MTRIIEPLNREAMGTNQRILEKLARVLSAEIKRKERLNKNEKFGRKTIC